MEWQSSMKGTLCGLVQEWMDKRTGKGKRKKEMTTVTQLSIISGTRSGFDDYPTL